MIGFVPIVLASVVLGPCPGLLPARVSCYDPPSRTIYLTAQVRREPFLVNHEFGHAFDYQRLTDADREQLARWFPDRVRPHWRDLAMLDRGDEERFADAYAACADGSSFMLDEFRSRGFRIDRICRFLRSRITASPGRAAALRAG